MLKYLLKNNIIEVNSKDKNEDTPLHIAALVGSRTCVKLLLSKGADPQSRNAESLTPLHKAAYGGSVR
jgi:ankyrin repeat protein